ncbi:MAG: hypothetical protein AAF736_10910 [Pseudomonadota bacterium]
MAFSKSAPLLGLALLLSVFSAAAQVFTQAFVPESGFYWNPEQPGRGYAIEVQDRQVFLPIYTYTDEANATLREPLWFSALGTLTATVTGPVSYRFDDELVFSEDGQCLGCAFRDPVSTFTGRPISLTFETLTTGQLLIDGELIPIQRFWYSPSIDDPYLAMQGQWIFVTDCTAPIDNNCFPSDVNVQPFEADLLTLDLVTGTGDDTTTEGLRSGTDLEVAGSYDAVENIFFVVVAETVNEFVAYVVFGEDFGTDQMNGIAERFVPGSNLTGEGFPTFGRRISDLTFSETLNPSAKTAAASAVQPRLSRSARNAAQLALLAQKDGRVTAPRSRAERLAAATPTLRALEAKLRAKASFGATREP